ncbi:phosphatidylinositol mannoside acyltransferase [Cellulomonas sp. HZM]|uniref:phosphatidylinositol mannoside acyltransferase n=1 Tax=Cellulomonas sp. HZM TaxID=1454010 RepID=UPI0004938FF8|nr:phosphatidylinositol mannoside acyltransferase [Cellulomonas sp. HZM]
MNAAQGYALAWRVAGRLPGVLVRWGFAVAADVAWLRHGSGVRRMEANYARIRPDLDSRGVRRLSRTGMRSYMRYYAEAFRLGSYTREQVDARVSTSGREHLDPVLEAGGSVVLALGHLGNWDLAGAWATRHLAPVTTVAERLKPEELFQEFLAFRESIGLRILALGDGDVFRDLVRTARTEKAVIPLLADRDLTSKGVEVDLCGRRARVAAGPAALAITSGSILCATAITYERLRGARRRAAGSPWGIHVRFHPPVEVPDVPRAERVAVMTQRWVDDLSQDMVRAPQDWHMLQKVFVEDLDPERYAATLAAEGA